MKMPCDRPKCDKDAPEGDLYCSTACFDLDNDPNPIQPIARTKVGGFGLEIHRMMVPEPVILARTGTTQAVSTGQQ